MVRTLGGVILTNEELATGLCEIEAVLNSRPIIAVSSDPSDMKALTPGHFIIGAPIRSLPPEPVRKSHLSCLKRWQTVCFLKQHFWQMWSKTYMLGLQDRKKLRIANPNIEVGKLVVIEEDNMPPQRWLIGRVNAVYAGADGKIADIKTPTGMLFRSIQRLAILPNQHCWCLGAIKAAGVKPDHWL